MNKQQTQVDQPQTGGDKRDLDSSLNKVAMSIGKYFLTFLLVFSYAYLSISAS